MGGFAIIVFQGSFVILVGYPTLQDICSSLLCLLLMFIVYVHCMYCLYWLSCSHASFGIYTNKNGLFLLSTTKFSTAWSFHQIEETLVQIYTKESRILFSLFIPFFFFFKGSEKKKKYIYIYIHTHPYWYIYVWFVLYYILINKLALKESIFCCCLTTFLHWWVTVNRAIISLTWNFVSFSL